MKILLKAILLGLGSSFAAHLISFACSNLVGALFFTDSHTGISTSQIRTANFTYVSVEGLFAVLAILLLLCCLKVKSIAYAGGIIMGSMLLFTVLLPWLDILVKGEYFMMVNIFAHVLLFPLFWYIYLKNRKCGATGIPIKKSA